MEIGGAERALAGLLSAFDPEKYSVDLFLFRHEGELMGLIPEGINLLPEKRAYSSMAVPIGRALRKLCFRVAYGRWRGKRAAAKYSKEHGINGGAVALEYSHRYTVKYMPQISAEEYDLAISFLTPHYYVAEKCRAKKKIAWIHTDYSYIDVDTVSACNVVGIRQNRLHLRRRQHGFHKKIPVALRPAHPGGQHNLPRRHQKMRGGKGRVRRDGREDKAPVLRQVLRGEEFR